MYKSSLFRRLATSLLVVSALALSSIAAADPAIWKISDADSEVYLFGSVHILKPDVKWRTDTLNRIIKDADLFYYEAETGKQAQAAIQKLALKYGLNKKGVTLTSYLDKSQAALLKRTVSQLGLPLARIQMLQPWFANINLVVINLVKSGYKPGQGVEQKLDALTPDAKERFFETAEKQLMILSSFPTDTAVEWLVATLHSMENQPEKTDQLVTAWRVGNINKLNDLVSGEMRKLDSSIYQSLIVERNKHWVEDIIKLMEGSQKALITVGAGHLAGDSSVQSLLEAEGFKVERIQ